MLKKFWLALCWALLAVVTVVSLGKVIRDGLNVNRDVLAAVPLVGRDASFNAAQAEYQNRLGKRLIFAVTEKDEKRLDTVTENFAAHLRASDLFENTRFRLQPEEVEKVGRYYFLKRRQLITPLRVSELKNKSPDQIINQKLTELYSPFGGIAAGTLATDPLGLYAEFLMNLRGSYSVEVKNGYFSSRDGDEFAHLIFTEVKGDWRDDDVQEAVLSHIDQFKEAKVLRLGVVPYTKANVESAKTEISTIGLGSMVGTLILLFVLFRSVAPLIVTSLFLFISTSIATLATHFIFGSVHIFTLVMGSSLIGVIVDYSFHFFSERFNENVRSGKEALNEIKGALVESFIATTLGFSFLFFTGFPVLQQLATFAVFGFSSGFLMVWTFYPLLPHSVSKAPKAFVNLTRMAGFVGELSSKTLWTALSVLVILLLVLSRGVKFNDNVTELQQLSPDLKSQEKVIRKMLGPTTSSAYILVRGNSLEDVLQNEEATIAKLYKDLSIQADGVSSWLPSAQAQRASFDYFTELTPLIKNFYEKISVSTSKQNQWLQNQNIPFKEFEFTDWNANFSTLPISMQYLGAIDGSFYTVVTLGKAVTAQQLAAINSINTQVVDFVGDISEALKAIRTRLFLSGIAGVCAIALALIVYMGLRSAVLVLAPPVLSALFAFLVSSYFLGAANLFSVMATVLIFFLGIDYSFYYRENGRRVVTATFVAVTASMLTNVMSFGFMSFSHTAAIVSFGVTITLGMLVTYILAPLGMRSSQ